MIEQYLQSVSHFLQLHPRLGFLFAFVVALAESLPLIGTIIPGSITMTAIGILVGRGMLPGLSTLIWASLGALTGDTIGFWLGKYYNEGIRNVWPFSKHPKMLTLGEDFFIKHGGKSILIGRFVGPARSSVPLIAGLLKMSWGRFLIAATPSAVLWSIAYTLPGVLIGAISLELPKGATTQFIIIALVVIVFLWFIFWAIQRFFIFLAACCNSIIIYCWNWFGQHRGARFLVRLIGNHSNPLDHHQLTTVIFAIISFILFITISLNVIYFGTITYLNEPIFHLLQSIRTHQIDAIFVCLTMLGDSLNVFIFGLFIVLGLIWKKQIRTACHLLALIIITSLCINFLKWIIYSPRPVGLAHTITSSSFPSGHTTLALTIFGFIAFITAKQLVRKWHWITYTTTAVVIALVGFSRLYLGAHWFTDILGSIFLGFSLLLAFITVYRRYPPKPFATTHWNIFVAIALIIIWGTYASVRYNTMIKRYRYIFPTESITLDAWWNNPTKYLPIYRLNRFGKPIQPFNLQWADTLRDIKQNLTRHGWITVHNMTNVKSTLGRFTSYKPEQHLPILPLLYRHKPPVLFLIKHVPRQKKIIELRLWSSGVTFNDSNLPIWIGSIDYHTPPQHLLTLKKPHEITLAKSGGINALQQDLKNYHWKKIIIPYVQPKQVVLLDWNGSVLIIRAYAIQPRNLELGNFK